jgi:hypothetical protein
MTCWDGMCQLYIRQGACIWNMHLENIYAYDMRIRSTPKRIFRMSQDLHHWWNYCFWRKVFPKRFAPLYFFSIVQVHNAFSLRYKWIEKFHNANLFENTIFASIVNYDWSIIKYIIQLCNFHRRDCETLMECIWNMHLGNIYAYNMRIRSTPKRIFRMSQDLHHWWNYPTCGNYTCIFNKEGQALRCKIGPTFYQKIMLDIE